MKAEGKNKKSSCFAIGKKGWEERWGSSLHIQEKGFWSGRQGLLEQVTLPSKKFKFKDRQVLNPCRKMGAMEGGKFLLPRAKKGVSLAKQYYL